MQTFKNIKDVEKGIQRSLEIITERFTGMQAIHKAEESLLDYIEGVNDMLGALGADYIITIDHLNFEEPTACRFYLNKAKIEKI